MAAANIDIVYEKRINVHGKYIFMALAMLATDRGIVGGYTHADLCKLFRISESSLLKYLRQLKKMDYLQSRIAEGTSRNVYFLNPAHLQIEKVYEDE